MHHDPSRRKSLWRSRQRTRPSQHSDRDRHTLRRLHSGNPPCWSRHSGRWKFSIQSWSRWISRGICNPQRLPRISRRHHIYPAVLGWFRFHRYPHGHSSRNTTSDRILVCLPNRLVSFRTCPSTAHCNRSRIRRRWPISATNRHRPSIWCRQSLSAAHCHHSRIRCRQPASAAHWPVSRVWRR